LDAIARGELKRNTFLERFYRGSKPGLHAVVNERATSIDPKTIGTIPLGIKDGVALNLRVGRYGPYIEFGDSRASVPEGLAAEEPLGHDANGEPVFLRTGRFGPYVQLGIDPGKEGPKPKRASLLKSMSPKDVSLEQALKLLSLPRTLGEDVDGNTITAALGRF